MVRALTTPPPPQVMITETTSTDGAESTDDEECMGECGGKTYRESRYSRIRQARGSKLIDALRGVKAGTTINVTTSSVLADHLCIRAPVRLLSTEQGEVEIWDGDLVVRKYGCAENDMSLNTRASNERRPAWLLPLWVWAQVCPATGYSPASKYECPRIVD